MRVFAVEKEEHMRSFIKRIMKGDDIAVNRQIHLIFVVLLFFGYVLFTRWARVTSFYWAYFWQFLFDAIILILCISYLNSDFEIRIAKPEKNFVRTVVLALLYAALFAAVSNVFYSFFFRVDVAFQWSPDITFSYLAVYLIVNVAIAFSEEALFRFYLYEWINARIKHAAISTILIAILFALIHRFFKNVPFVVYIGFGFFSLYESFLRRRHKDSFYLCSLVHLFYNCILNFVVTVSF